MYETLAEPIANALDDAYGALVMHTRCVMDRVTAESLGYDQCLDDIYVDDTMVVMLDHQQLGYEVYANFDDIPPELCIKIGDFVIYPRQGSPIIDAICDQRPASNTNRKSA